MKTLQEIKEEVANEHGFYGWHDAEQTAKRSTLDFFLNKIAKLYAEQAITADREHVAKEATKEWDEIDEKWVVDKSSIIDAQRLPLP